MIEFQCSGILLDIEGTTSSIRFVYDEMFPFARRELKCYLTAHFSEAPTLAAAEQIAIDAGATSFDDLCQQHPDVAAPDVLEREVTRQMDQDLKATGLKQLQGLIWKSGFESGELKAHLYPEVAACLRSWHAEGITLRIYSSGSIAAQKLFFSHTIDGDLLALIDGHDDTTTGPKKEQASYQAIANKFGLPPEQLLFLSDVPAELDAAADAGMQTCWSCRPENPPSENVRGHLAIESFDQLHIAK